MRISPAVGSSRPAIMRSSVVLPDPEGPRRTRNSPSRLSRSTLLTAPTLPRLKTFVSLRVCTIAIVHVILSREDGEGSQSAQLEILRSAQDDEVSSFPLGENAPQLRIRCFDCRFRGHLASRRFGEHRRQYERVERF